MSFWHPDPMYVPHSELGYMHGEAPELDRKLREGDGLAWRGDPRLELRMGIATAKRSGPDSMTGKWKRRGDIVGRRYEVWRAMEDGGEQRIGHWRLEEFDRLLLDLATMDPRSPGHENLADRLEREERKIEKVKSDEFREAVAPMLEHQMRLAHDTTQPLVFFPQAGWDGPAESMVTPADPSTAEAQ